MTNENGRVRALPEVPDFIGGAEEGRTPGLRIANWTTGKNVSICLFESCGHRRNFEVFPSFPISYHRAAVACCYSCPRIGHARIVNQGVSRNPTWHLKTRTSKSVKPTAFLVIKNRAVCPFVFERPGLPFPDRSNLPTSRRNPGSTPSRVVV